MIEKLHLKKYVLLKQTFFLLLQETPEQWTQIESNYGAFKFKYVGFNSNIII